MRVLVTGASGVVGVHLIPHLVRRGHEVIRTTRSSDKLEQLQALGAEPLLLDGLDAIAVGETVARVGPDAIIHEMTSLRGRPDLRHFDRWFATTNELRTRGTANLLAAARPFGRQTVRRAELYRVKQRPRWVDGQDRSRRRSTGDPAPQQRETLAAIKAMEAMVLEAPLDGIVLRHANQYGPEASASNIELLKKRMFPIIGDGGGVTSWLHVEDAAIGTVDALERARPGIYNLADDDPAPTREWLPYLAGRRRGTEAVPRPRLARSSRWRARQPSDG